MSKLRLFSLCLTVILMGCTDKPTPQALQPAPVDPKVIAETYASDEAKKSGDCEVFYTKQVSGSMGDPKTDGIALVYATGNCKGGGNAVMNTVAVLEVKDGKGYLVSKAQLSPMEVSSVDSVAINSDGDVQLDVKSFGPDDPRCCPSVNKKIRFAFVNRNLVRLAEEAPSRPQQSQPMAVVPSPQLPSSLSRENRSNDVGAVKNKRFPGEHQQDGVTYFDAGPDSCAAINGLTLSLSKGIAAKYSVSVNSIRLLSASYGGKGSYCSVVVDTPIGPKTCVAPSVVLSKTGQYLAFTIATLSDGRKMVMDNACYDQN